MKHPYSASEDKSVYDSIKELLISYTFFPGDRLHVPELADQLRVSATPVREALNRFCAEGLLTAVPHRGFFVKKLDQNEISDLLLMKHMLLSYAIQGVACDLQLQEAEARMLKTLSELTQEKGDPVVALEAYERYSVPMNLLIASLSNNAVLFKSLGNVLDKLHFVRRTEVRMEDRAQSVFVECAEIAQALLMSRGAEVQACLDRQLQREQSMLASLMKECINRLYLRGEPAPMSRPNEHRARLAMLSL